MKPIIGIVARSGLNKENKPIFEVLDNYRKAIIKAGGIPIVILPPQLVDYNTNEVKHLTEIDKEILKKQVDLVQGVLMPGGTRAYDYDRYICEISQNKPLLGICMGMQIMCNYNNDNKNIKLEDNSHQQPDKEYVHEVIIDKNSYLYEIIKEEKILVNSRHNYTVANSGSYKVVGTNKIIEAVEKEGSFNIGVQWHPEKTDDIISQRLFNKFIEEAKKVITNP